VPLEITAPIETERLVLRPLRPGDLSDVAAYQSRDDVVRYLPWDARTREESREHLARRVLWTRLESDGDFLAVAVELPAGDGGPGRVIGDLSLILTSVAHRQAELGWVFHPDFHGQGYATEAVARLLELAFSDLESHRIFAQLDPRNDSSARLCERLGMRREAHLLNDQIFKGEFADTYIYAILDIEWTTRAAIDG